MTDEYVKDVTETHVCKICEEPTRQITDYGLCKKCDDWLLHLQSTKSGRKDLQEAHQKVLADKKKNRTWRKKP